MRTARFSEWWESAQTPWMQTLPWRQNPLEVDPPCRQTPSPVNRMTHASKNITLHKALFAGRNEEVFTLFIIDSVTTS